VSKQSAIRHESELVREFQQFLEQDRDLPWEHRGEARKGVFNSIGLNFDGRRIQFEPIYALKPGAEDLPDQTIGLREEGPLPLLVTAQLSPRILDLCRQRHLSAIDLNGRTFLRTEGLLVDRAASPGRNYVFELEPRNIFVGKSARIIRTLLTDRGKTWAQSELITRTGASSGLVSRIIKHLLQQGYLQKEGARELRIKDPLGLLDAWAESDSFSRRTHTFRYASFGGDPRLIAGKLRSLSEELSLPLAFTQWYAGWLREPYAEPVIVSAYVQQLPTDAQLAGIGLRPVTEAGNVWLHVPNDEGVLKETQIADGFRLVTDSQIYLDLQKTGLRGPEQAQALRESPRFCLP
jgi:hypothetical protein